MLLSLAYSTTLDSILFSPAAGRTTVSLVPSLLTVAFSDDDSHLNETPVGAVGRVIVVSSFSGITTVAPAIAASTFFKFSLKFIGSHASLLKLLVK